MLTKLNTENGNLKYKQLLLCVCVFFYFKKIQEEAC